MKRYKSNRVPKRIIGCGNLRCETCNHMLGTEKCEAEEGLIVEEKSLNELDKIMENHFQNDEIKPTYSQSTLKTYQ